MHTFVYTHLHMYEYICDFHSLKYSVNVLPELESQDHQDGTHNTTSHELCSVRNLNTSTFVFDHLLPVGVKCAFITSQLISLYYSLCLLFSCKQNVTLHTYTYCHWNTNQHYP